MTNEVVSGVNTIAPWFAPWIGPAIVASVVTLVGQFVLTRLSRSHEREKDAQRAWTDAVMPVEEACDDVVARFFDIIVRKRQLDFNQFDAMTLAKGDVLKNPSQQLTTTFRLVKFLAGVTYLQRKLPTHGDVRRVRQAEFYVSNKIRMAQADTQEKRELVANLLMNAGGTKLCPDDLVRLFISWIDIYHEAHFRVIREIYQNPGSTRGRIWDAIAGERPREDSAEADLYKLLIRDLSTGGVIRQRRETDGYGQFLKKPRETKQHSSGVLTSAFDDRDPYELTELGRQFVHYTMNDLVTRIGGPTTA